MVVKRIRWIMQIVAIKIPLMMLRVNIPMIKFRVAAIEVMSTRTRE